MVGKVLRRVLLEEEQRKTAAKRAAVDVKQAADTTA
jgi:hypothetical protein